MAQLNLQVQPRQRLFIESPAFETLYGGAAGGGKSYAQLIDAMLYALKYPRSRQLIFRRTYPELENSLISVQYDIMPLAPFYRYNKTAHIGTFHNGSTIKFGNLQHEDSKYDYKSAEYDVIRFDEATQFTETQYLYMLSRCRGANGYPKGMKLSTNPDGIGNAWIKARFVEPAPPDNVFSAKIRVGGYERTTTRVYIPARLSDNHILMRSDPEYLTRLLTLPENERKALLDGEWDLFEGQFFNEWNATIHVCKPFEIPHWWKRYRVLDYGMDMLACLWIAVNEHGRAFVYKILYEGKDNGKGLGGRGHIISAAARRILEVNGDDVITDTIGPMDMGNRSRETGKSQQDLFREAGVSMQLAGTGRADGWLAMREYLAIRELPFGAQGPLQGPMLQIFENCTDLIRTLPKLQYSEKDPADIRTDPHELTHAPDALRGFCSYFVSKAMPPKAVGQTLEDIFHTKARQTPAQALGEGSKDEVF